MNLAIESEFVRSTGARRLAGAVTRRVRRAWRRAAYRVPQGMAVERAVEWLSASARSGWLPKWIGDQPCTTTTARAAGTARAFGQDELADSLSLAISEALVAQTEPAICSFGDPRSSPTALGTLAIHWFRHGLFAAADRAMNGLRRRQLEGGGFRERVREGRGTAESVVAVLAFLEASLLEVESWFDRDRDAVPCELPRDDGRLVAIVERLCDLGPDARIADVGCGRGRYLARLCELYPRARLVGVDPSCRFLCELPPRVERVQGGLLRLPLPESSCDAAFAVESLEHSLVPRRAVAELVRIVRPGGRLAIIDKHRDHQPLSHSAPWERWFLPEEVAAWLDAGSVDVKCSPLDVAGDKGRGPFLIWTARRRGEVVS